MVKDLARLPCVVTAPKCRKRLPWRELPSGPTKGVNRGSAVQSHVGRNREAMRQEKAILSSWNEIYKRKRTLG